MTRAIIVAALQLASSLVPAGDSARVPRNPGDVGATDGGRMTIAAASPLPPSVINQVIDLLDRQVLLESNTDHEVWESAPLATAQFTRIGLRISAEQENQSSVVCNAAWQFAEEDEFLGSIPVTSSNGFGFLQQVSDGLPPDFTEVRGLRAKVFCRVVFTGIGDDPGPPPVSAVLTDVKVLLRREL